MEGTPYNPEYSPEQDIEKKKKPSAETIGALFLEKNPELELRKNVTKEKLGQALVDLEINKPKRETNFELDPILRHLDDDLVVGGSTSTNSLGGLLQKADQSIATDSSQNDSQSSDTSHTASPGGKPGLKIADILMYTIIIVLATLVIMLIITRN